MIDRRMVLTAVTGVLIASTAGGLPDSAGAAPHSRSSEIVTTRFNYIAVTHPWGRHVRGTPRDLVVEEQTAIKISYAAEDGEIPMVMAGASDKVINVLYRNDASQHERLAEVSFGCRHKLTVGRFRVNTPDSDCALDFQYNNVVYGGTDSDPGPGTVAVTEVDLDRRYHGKRAPSFAMTYEMHTRKCNIPQFGAVGGNATHGFSIPGITRAPVPSGVHIARTHGGPTLSWARSPDIAVHRYVVRRRAGVHDHVGIGKHVAVSDGSARRVVLPAHLHRPQTLSIYAVDDLGRASRPHTIVLR